MVASKNIIKELQQLKADLEKNIQVKHMLLFGSYAKDKAKASSDIDVAIFSDDFKGIRFYDVIKLLPYTRQVNPYIELHPYPTTAFFSDEEWFVQEIKKTGIEI